MITLDFVVVRHAATDWNRDKKLQGRRDIPLSTKGEASLVGKQIPNTLRDRSWYCSPLTRTRQTAERLGIQDYQLCNDLIEMDWGDWEGQRIGELRSKLGEAMTAMEARGLDLLPPNGESPRQVRQRLLDWLRSLPLNGVIKAGAVTHKGVIRALLTEATGWDMQSSCPVKIDWACALRFTLEVQGADTQGKLHLSDYNIPLTRTAG